MNSQRICSHAPVAALLPTRVGQVLESKLHSKKVDREAFQIQAEIMAIIGGEEDDNVVKDFYNSIKSVVDAEGSSSDEEEASSQSPTPPTALRVSSLSRSKRSAFNNVGSRLDLYCRQCRVRTFET